MAQFVDIETAKEFMKETLSKAELQALKEIRADLFLKSEAFQELLLSREGAPSWSKEELQGLFRRIFATRRKTETIFKSYSAEELSEWIRDLLFSEAALPRRFQTFCSRLDKLDESIRYDVAGEILHFTQPEKYWLWTRWIWDPHTKTGALPLVITEDYNLEGDTPGDVYIKIGEVITFLEHVGRAAEVELFDQGPFGVDTYLSCVYVVYVYTVLRLRMTQEFNKVMPGLLEFSRRLLGVYRMEEPKHAS